MSECKTHFKYALLPEGWAENVLVAIDASGAITAVTTGADAGDAQCFAGTALPGVPNVHSHAHQRAMAGLAERSGPGPDSFWTWREVMYGFVARMGPDELEAIAAQLYVEMLKAGYTAVGEFQYLHHGPGGSAYDNAAEMSLRTVAAAELAGIGLTSLPTLYAHGGFGGAETNARQGRFLNSETSFLEIVTTLLEETRGNPNRNVGISPHSLRAVTPELLSSVLEEVNRQAPDAPIHIHVAEQVREVEDCLSWSGERPVEFLLNRFDIDARWCLIHATHMSEEETKRVAASECVAGLCPTTEANLGDGLFRALDYLRAGGRIALGTDSHISVSPVEDLRLLEYGQRLSHKARNVLNFGPDTSTGRSLLDRVLSGGAQALGRNIGAIAPGARADIIVLDDRHPLLYGRAHDDLIDAWIFSGNTPSVSDVIVGGAHLVHNGRHRHEDVIFTRFCEALDRLKD